MCNLLQYFTPINLTRLNSQVAQLNHCVYFHLIGYSAYLKIGKGGVIQSEGHIYNRVKCTHNA